MVQFQSESKGLRSRELMAEFPQRGQHAGDPARVNISVQVQRQEKRPVPQCEGREAGKQSDSRKAFLPCSGLQLIGRAMCSRALERRSLRA